MVLYGKIVNTKEENPNRENNMKVWKSYTIENAIVIKEKPWKPSTWKQ